MSWKKYQKRVQLKRWLRRILIGVTGVVLIVVGISSYRGWQWLNGSNASSQFNYGAVSWDKEDQINLWLPRENLLVALDAQEGTLRRRGTEGKGGQEGLEKSTIFVDGYILLQPSSSSPFAPPLPDIGLRQLLGSRSNLSRRQLVRVWWELRQLDENDIQQTNDFSETAIKAERLKIEVLNGSDTPGLAAAAAERVEGLGAEVIAVGNIEDRGPEVEDGSLRAKGENRNRIIAYNVSKGSRTVERLEEVFKTEAEFMQNVRPRRADVVVVVGSSL